MPADTGHRRLQPSIPLFNFQTAQCKEPTLVADMYVNQTLVHTYKYPSRSKLDRDSNLKLWHKAKP